MPKSLVSKLAVERIKLEESIRKEIKKREKSSEITQINLTEGIL